MPIATNMGASLIVIANALRLLRSLPGNVSTTNPV
jgi:hypothetical protein